MKRPDEAPFTTYQLHIELSADVEVKVGRLGCFLFRAGRYVYTGSARRNLEARVARHLRRDKTLRWHIDYLLARPEARVLRVERSNRNECAWNQSVHGKPAAPGFGASDCRAGCGAHLLRLTDV
ncbi:MAG: GIY-YIG nuclease family protein [Gammaproteobacteria bacterium]